MRLRRAALPSLGQASRHAYTSRTWQADSIAVRSFGSGGPRPLPSSPADFMLLPLPGDMQILPAAADGHQSVLAERIWLDEKTDMPVRAELTAPGGRMLIAETFAWLSPIAANRAELSPAPVPAGFRLTPELAH